MKSDTLSVLVVLTLLFQQLHNQGFFAMQGVTIPDKHLRRPFPDPIAPVMAPFWSDIKNEYADYGNIYWRETQNELTLKQATEDVREHLSDTSNFTATSVLVATWFAVIPTSSNLNDVSIYLAS